MARYWLVNGRTIAKKVKNPTWSSASQLQCKESELIQECPNCHHFIKNTDEWPGLPCGVKFDPSDAELLEHLAAKSKCGTGNEPHLFIDEFIPTIEVEQGICYTHPKNLPGAKKDGSSIHFFHRTVNAYTTGQRKRRKIQHNVDEEHVRWHKTGKTKPVLEKGILKGWKKFMVLYKSSKKGIKPDKSNWVMHQYHLGDEEEEKEGEYVVSKISYHHHKQHEVTELEYAAAGPNTPPPPLLSCKSSPIDDMDSTLIDLGWLGAESRAIDDTEFLNVDDLLVGGESQEGLNQIFDSCLVNKSHDSANIPCGLSELEKLDFDSPPDLLHPDLPLGSQENINDWLY